MTNDEIYSMVLDNTASVENYKELGIFKFAKLFFPDRFKDEFAILHYDMVKLLFQLLNPKLSSAVDRKRYFLVHREAAKTTIGTFLFPVYLLYLKGMTVFVTGELLDRKDKEEIFEILIDEKFIAIASATATTAQEFVINLKDTIESRQDLADIFGEKNPKYIDVEDERSNDRRWTKSLFITADNQVVKGIGIGQQVRGSNIKGSRPTMIIVDDIYTENNSKTEYARREVRRWYENAVENSLDSHSGKILTLGTMIHPDSIFKGFRNSMMYSGIERPIISMEDLQKCIEKVKEDGLMEDVGFFKSSRSLTYFLELEATITSLSWAERHPLRTIIIKYLDKFLKNDLNWFYQEYMNEPVAPEMQMIQEKSFHKTELNWYQRNGQQHVEFQYEQALWYGVCNLFIGIDPAASEATTSDDTAIVVAGYANCFPKIPGMDLMGAIELKENKIFPIIAHIEGGKYSIHDYENLKGMCEAVTVLCNRYVIQNIRVEAMGQQMQIVREIRQHMKHHRVIEQYNTISKSERILSIMLSIVQKYSVIICPKFPLVDKMYYQLLTCGISDHDDYADGTAIAFTDATVPAYVNEYVHNESTDTNTRWADLVELYGKDAWLYL